jgi:hypothetical protein
MRKKAREDGSTKDSKKATKAMSKPSKKERKKVDKTTKHWSKNENVATPSYRTRPKIWGWVPVSARTERLYGATLRWMTGGSARSPSSFAVRASCADRVQSMVRLVPQPGQNTSSHGVPATSAARMVGDHSMSRPVARRRFQRSMTSAASRRAAGTPGAAKPANSSSIAAVRER